MITDFLKQLKKELKLTKKDFKLLLEAYRRKHLIEYGFTKHNDDFLGLGTPADYKSKYFTCSTGRPIARIRNWFKLTVEGEEMMTKIETKMPLGKFGKFDLNEFLFLY